jgi:hypothetical protein
VPSDVIQYDEDALRFILANLPGRHLWPQDEVAKLLKVSTAPRALTSVLAGAFGANWAASFGAVKLFEDKKYHFPSKSMNDQNEAASKAAQRQTPGKPCQYPPHVYNPQALVAVKNVIAKNHDCVAAMIECHYSSHAR